MNVEVITSRENQRLKEVRRIREGTLPGLVFAEGVRLCEEVLRSSAEIIDCYFAEGLAAADRGAELLQAIQNRGIKLFQLGKKAFDSIADTKSPQGVIIVCRRPEASLEALAGLIGNNSSTPVVVFLDRINNPLNLGAIARTAEAAGVPGLIVSTQSTDVYSAKAIRASMGAVFRLNIVENVSLSDAAGWATVKNLMVCAADGRAEHSYTEVDWTKPRLLVFGSEAHGVDERHIHLVEEKIRIPMKNDVESLNVAVSSGILLFEAVRQNETKNIG